jgi:hypothetical protein
MFSQVFGKYNVWWDFRIRIDSCEHLLLLAIEMKSSILIFLCNIFFSNCLNGYLQQLRREFEDQVVVQFNGASAAEPSGSDRFVTVQWLLHVFMLLWSDYFNASMQWWFVCSSKPTGVILVSGFCTFGIVLRTARGEEMYKTSSIKWHIKERFSKLRLCWLCEHCSISCTVTGFIPQNASKTSFDSFQTIFPWYYYSWTWSYLCPRLLPWTFTILERIPGCLASSP